MIDFSKVNKMFIPEGEVQIALKDSDKIWDKPTELEYEPLEYLEFAQKNTQSLFHFELRPKRAERNLAQMVKKKDTQLRVSFFYPHEIGAYSVRLSVFTFAFSFGLQACSPKQMASAIS